MKFNTKSLTPTTKDYSFTNDNTFIPTKRQQADHGDGGREILYETVVVSTPVLASARVFNDETPDKKKKRLLSKNDVDELNDMLGSLYLGAAPSSAATIKKEGAPQVHAKSVQQEETKQEADESSNLGRREMTFCDSKVLRSARFMK